MFILFVIFAWYQRIYDVKSQPKFWNPEILQQNFYAYLSKTQFLFFEIPILTRPTTPEPDFDPFAARVQ